MKKTAVQTAAAPQSKAPLSQAIVHQGFVFVSGQGAVNPSTGEYEKGTIQSETKRVLQNISAVLAAANSSLEKVVKVNVYLRDIGDFAAMNEVYAQFFTAPFPARTTIQAGALPRGFAVEIDCTAHQ